ncbi:hypothetical protein WR25_26406 [Diploscapter pachys]|uniref:SCP domain-containing protein n=1 Tax=Diploscapter pachys TaxID=2018661 RepID=A0A2A2M0Z8_9BILA|nr:hypothetical protein WR25_26406 [Diploscapter pachys]
MTQLYQFLSISAILISQISGAPRLDGNQLSQFLAVQNLASGGNIWNDQLSQAEKNMILQQHNSYRSQCALGKFANKPGAGLGPYLPRAAKMPELKWDKNLEASAYRHAMKKEFKHSTDLKNTGENLYMMWTTGSFNRQNIIKDMSQAWINEVPQSGLDSIILPSGQKFYNVGHATAMLSDRTTRIGCAMVGMAPGKVLGVCHYSPIGNIFNSAIYATGATGSQCPAPSKLNPQTGLCVYP